MSGLLSGFKCECVISQSSVKARWEAASFFDSLLQLPPSKPCLWPFTVLYKNPKCKWQEQSS